MSRDQSGEHILSVPGDENVDILDALLESPIRFITARREQGAALMSDVYVRLTGKAGLCLSTLGPVARKVKNLVSFDHPCEKAGTA
jgi:thiamine pyrophosphate-dependent acetolactate synthase large subunit-like protein